KRHRVREAVECLPPLDSDLVEVRNDELLAAPVDAAVSSTSQLRAHDVEPASGSFQCCSERLSGKPETAADRVCLELRQPQNWLGGDPFHRRGEGAPPICGAAE